MAFGVAARAGIAVPIPGAADAVRRLQQPAPRGQAGRAGTAADKGRKAGADDQRVEVVGLSGLSSGNRMRFVMRHQRLRLKSVSGVGCRGV